MRRMHHAAEQTHTIRENPSVQSARAAQGMIGPENQLCLQLHYAAIVDVSRDVEIHQQGDAECPRWS